MIPQGSLRATVVLQRFPFPTNHGGLVDAVGLMRGLKSLGVSLQAVFWYGRDESASEYEVSLLRGLADDIVALRRCGRVGSLLSPVVPPMAASHALSRAELDDLCRRVEEFGARWVLLDSWPGALAAVQLSRRLHLPLVYRSQNVERIYLRECARRALGWVRVKLGVNALLMWRWEAWLRGVATAVWDIAAEDAEYWRACGRDSNIRVVPPVWDSSRGVLGRAEAEWDVVYVGNLRTANNVEGLMWFIDHVLPRLREQYQAQLKILVAGSSPARRVVEHCELVGIEVVANPVDTAQLYSRSRVAINPVRMGAGVNMKMLEMLGAGVPVVGTSSSVRGLPEPVRALVRVADSPRDFADAVLFSLSESEQAADRSYVRRTLDGHFGVSRLKARLAEL